MEAIPYKEIFDYITSAVLIIEDSRTIDGNRAAIDLFGAQGKDDLVVMPHISRLISDSFQSDTNPCRVTVLHPEEGELDMEVRKSPVGKSGRTFLLECRIIEEKALFREITLHSSYTHELFDHYPDAMTVLNSTGMIMDVNCTFEDVFGYTRHESVRKNLAELLCGDSTLLHEKSLSPERSTIHMKLIPKNRNPIDTVIFFYPVLIDNRYTGSYLLLRDISEEQETRRLLEEKEEFLQQLFQRSLFPIAVLDTMENILDINREFENLFHFTREEALGNNINTLIIPEEKREESSQFIREILRKRTKLAKTRRMDKFGRRIDVEAVGSPVIIGGRVAGMFAMYKDISAEEQALQEMLIQKAYFQQLFDNSPDAIALIDQEDRIVTVNISFESIFGFTLNELESRFLNEYIVPDSLRAEADSNTRFVVESKQHLKVESKRRHKSGCLIDVEILAYPIYLNSSQLGAFAVYRDISDRRKKEQEIQRLAYTDYLTNLNNRKYFYDILTRNIKDHPGHPETEVMIYYFDLDNFKEINDTYGHKAGDILLRSIADRMQAGLPQDYVLARLGGDEFAAISAENISEPGEVMEGMRSLFYEPFIVQGTHFTIGMSIGYARYPQDGRTVDELLHSADYRMYKEKRRKQAGN